MPAHLTLHFLRKRHSQREGGVTYEQTFLTENDSFGIVNPT